MQGKLPIPCRLLNKLLVYGITSLAKLLLNFASHRKLIKQCFGNVFIILFYFLWLCSNRPTGDWIFANKKRNTSSQHKWNFQVAFLRVYCDGMTSQKWLFKKSSKCLGPLMELQLALLILLVKWKSSWPVITSKIRYCYSVKRQSKFAGWKMVFIIFRLKATKFFFLRLLG